MADTIDCPNRDVNLEMCPCPNEECERRGICCLCVQNHTGKGGTTFCMRDTERPEATLALSGCGTKCDRHAETLELCPCDYEGCDNRATCCDCIRNHWGNSTYPSPACMN